MSDFEKRSRSFTDADGQRVTETVYGVSPGCLMQLIAPYAAVALLLATGMILSQCGVLHG